MYTVSSKQSAHQKTSAPISGGHRVEHAFVLTNSPLNRKEKRAYAKSKAKIAATKPQNGNVK
jgi:hypothetical protein